MTPLPPSLPLPSSLPPSLPPFHYMRRSKKGFLSQVGHFPSPPPSLPSTTCDGARRDSYHRWDTFPLPLPPSLPLHAPEQEGIPITGGTLSLSPSLPPFHYMRRSKKGFLSQVGHFPSPPPSLPSTTCAGARRDSYHR